MKNLILLFLLFFYPPNKPKLTCADFHVGTFDLPSVDGSTHRIIREENKQTEFVGKTGLETEFDLKWLSKCTYIIYNKRIIKGQDDLPELDRDTLICEIKKIAGSACTVTTSFKRFNLKLDAEMKKIK